MMLTCLILRCHGGKEVLVSAVKSEPERKKSNNHPDNKITVCSQPQAISSWFGWFRNLMMSEKCWFPRVGLRIQI